MPRIEPRYILRELLKAMIEQAEVLYQNALVPYRYDIRLNRQDYEHVSRFISHLKRDAIEVLNEQYKRLSNLKKTDDVPPLQEQRQETPKAIPSILGRAAKWLTMEATPDQNEPVETWRQNKEDLFPVDLYAKLMDTKPFRNKAFYVEIAPDDALEEGICKIEIFFDPDNNDRSTILLYQVNSDERPQIKKSASRKSRAPSQPKPGASVAPTIIMPIKSDSEQDTPHKNTPYAKVVLMHPQAKKPIILKKETSFGRQNCQPPADIDLGATENISGIHFLIRYNHDARQAEIKDISHPQLHTWVNGTEVTPSRDAQKGDLDIWYPLPPEATIHAGYDQSGVAVQFQLL